MIIPRYAVEAGSTPDMLLILDETVLLKSYLPDYNVRLPSMVDAFTPCNMKPTGNWVRFGLRATHQRDFGHREPVKTSINTRHYWQADRP